MTRAWMLLPVLSFGLVGAVASAQEPAAGATASASASAATPPPLPATSASAAATPSASASAVPYPPPAAGGIAGAPAAPPPATTGAPAPAASPPPDASAPPPLPVAAARPPAPGGRYVTADTPLRLRDLIKVEADRGRASRYFSATLGVLGGAGTLVSGFVMLDTTSGAADNDPNAEAVRVYSYLVIGTGGLIALTSLYSFFSRSPMERLYDAYAPVAADGSVPVSVRLERGESALAAMAEADRSSRIISGVTGLIGAAVLGGFAVYFAANSGLTDYDRVLFGMVGALSGVAAAGSAIASLTFERGEAEIAWEHWQASQGMLSSGESQSRLTLTPQVAVLPGGMQAGLAARF